MKRLTLPLAAALIALVVAAPVSAGASKTRLTGVVGPGFTITLKKGTTKVRTLPHGVYAIVVSDKSNIHNFHLKGPGVNKMTGVGATGTRTWVVTLRKGKYTYVCDPHASAMRGSFTVT